MYENPVKTRIRQTVRFVQQHPTLCACAATAVITAKLTRDDDIATLKDMMGQLMLAEAERAALLTDTTSFIDARGLTEEFFAWAPRLRRE